MRVLELVAQNLRQLGADGLCNDECGCGLDDLAPCKDWIGDCVPAMAVKVWDEEGGCETGYIPQEKSSLPLRPDHP